MLLSEIEARKLAKVIKEISEWYPVKYDKNSFYVKPHIVKGYYKTLRKRRSKKDGYRDGRYR